MVIYLKFSIFCLLKWFQNLIQAEFYESVFYFDFIKMFIMEFIYFKDKYLLCFEWQKDFRLVAS